MFSFPSSAWERQAPKLCFVTTTNEPNLTLRSEAPRLEAELRGGAFPSRAWERGPTPPLRFGEGAQKRGVEASVPVQPLLFLDETETPTGRLSGRGADRGGPLRGGTLRLLSAGETRLDDAGCPWRVAATLEDRPSPAVLRRAQGSSRPHGAIPDHPARPPPQPRTAGHRGDL